MAENEEPDVDETQSGDGTPPSGGEEEAPKLIAGKFKTQEEFETAYHNAERKISDQGSKSSQYRQMLEQMGYSLDGEGNVVGEPQVEGEQGNPPDDDWRQKLTERFWADPLTVASDLAGNMLTQALKTQKQARANTKRAISELKADPMFRDVVDDLEAEIESVDDQYLADAKQTPVIVNALYERVVGRYAMKRAKTAKEDPTARAELLAKLGVESPVSSDGGGALDVTATDRNVLSELGIKGEATKRVIENYRKRMSGGES